MKPPSEKSNVKKVEVQNVKIDPIVVDMPKIHAEFVRFESSPDGQRFFIVYEIVTSWRKP